MSSKTNELIEQIPFVRESLYTKYIKRMLDFTLALIAVIVLSPIYLLVAVLELVFHGRPILYKSVRPGKDERLFSIYKFRSMTNETDENRKLLPENRRITRFGRFLRRTSLDEIPELFNIVRGDMAIIGPRPLLPEYRGLYSERHRRRHSVRPGLACERILENQQHEPERAWTWNEQFENDIWYIENTSFLVDLKILLAILKEVIVGSSYRVDVTRVRFDGTNLNETRSTHEIEKAKAETHICSREAPTEKQFEE